jgi:8-oxo-dGTP pyrophosphatase MutT (NUDIX family)
LLRNVLSKLDSAQPEIESAKLAAVSVIVAGEDRLSTLLIKRAKHQDDPWSGQIAFPGGKLSKDDTSAKETAIREAREEVGVDLVRNAKFAGYHTPFRTHTGEMDVIPAVFLTPRELEVTPNHEVAGFKWVLLEEFLHPRSASTYHLEFRGSFRNLPAFAVGDYVIWGLTHRIISSLLG